MSKLPAKCKASRTFVLNCNDQEIPQSHNSRQLALLGQRRRYTFLKDVDDVESTHRLIIMSYLLVQ